MKYIEIIAEAGAADTLRAIAETADIVDFRLGAVDEGGLQATRMLVSDDKLQPLLDALQNVLGAQPRTHIVVLAVETALPKPDDEKRRQEDSAMAAREALYEEAEKGVRLDGNFCVLVILSTIVAAIGLIENNVAVIIGAMVIAPLLGPNLALSLGTALGDVALMRRSVQTLLTGIVLAAVFSAVLGLAWPSAPMSDEIMARTDISLDAIALALASGAAAALSLTTGLSSVLVGVMVAVALLPPAATMGLMLGLGQAELAINAGLLLAINVVCVNLASKLVFLFKGIRPRTWLEAEKAQSAMRAYISVWLVTLLLLVVIIYSRGAITQ